MQYSSKDILIEILNEKQLDAFSPYIKRNYEITFLPRKANVITGVRRAGKTTFLKQIWDKVEKKVPHSIQFYLNFSDDRISNLVASELQFILEAILEIAPEVQEQMLFLYLDEIQLIEGWELFVDRLLRRPKTQVILSGSSAKLLSQEIATELRGRSIALELTPFSFNEFLKANGLKFTASHQTTPQRLKIEKALLNYLKRGGFPEVSLLPTVQMRPIVQEYIHSIFYRDIIERHNVSDPNRLFYLLKSLIQQSGSLFTLNKTTDKMKSIGYHIEKSTVSNALQWFTDAYCIFAIPCFAESLQKQQTNPKKVYSIDNSLITAIQTISIDQGHLLENIIFQELRRRTTFPIYYYKTSNGLEVDFFVESYKKGRMLIQVCYDLSDEDVFEREVRALKEAAIDTKITQLKLLFIKPPKVFEKNGKIEFIPVWRFLLKEDF